MGRSQKLSELATAYQAAPLTFRNRIINGDMRIDQRNAGASVNVPDFANAFYTVDRMGPSRSGFSTLAMSAQQVTDAPTGFSNSLRITIGTGQASTPATAACVGIDHRIEGFHTADFAFGTAAAAAITLSFWVKASITGLYGIGLFNASVNRCMTLTYSVNAANTWEFKTITIPGDTTGTWNVTNGIGLGMQFDVGSGSNSNGTTTGVWGATFRCRTAACVTPSQTTGATWQLTGLQLEVGTVATPFERRDYGRELMMCHRYFYRQDTPVFQNCVAVGSTFQNNGQVGVQFPTVMRAAPTVTASFVNRDNASSVSVSALGNSVTPHGVRYAFAVTNGSFPYAGFDITSQNSAEL